MFLLFSDLHADNYRLFSTILENGLNSRLVAQTKIINQVKLIARKYKVTQIFFLGDLFNNQSPNINKILYNVLFFMIQSLAEVVPICLLTGNHDLFNNTHLFTPFSSIPNVTIINNVTTIQLDGKTIDLIPWVLNDPGHLPVKKSDYCFAHFGIQGADIGNNFVIEEAIDPVTLKDYKLVLAGHFHTRQQVADNAYQIGSIMANSFKDYLHEDKGVWILDPTDDKLTFIPIASPKFHTLEFFKQEQIDTFKFNPNDYYRVILKSDNLLIHNANNVITEFDYDQAIIEDIVDTSDITNLLPIISEFIEKSNTSLPKDILIKKAIELLEV